MSQPDQKPDQTPDLGAELRELGQQIEAALRTALESERARQLQQELLNGLRTVGEQVQSAVKVIAENPRVQELAERGQQTLHQLQQSQAAHDLQQTLAQGIAQLNAQLAEFIKRMQSPAGGEPATGETTRLDQNKDDF
ncbi:hypothetical protein [Chloroflexus sp.]|uniref:hypothetical protein n=1 Tax=Chloroflexus sp. TaxID=1904827 RepID=UPI00298F38A8|nr:hypothetical protein [Chloroflexus sp.]MCS6888976.1 hypothetical protein [Chloroflexus sp.]MCX7859078.1 hypothetical protein [Chloroflexus sp.]MDW8404195.1 hypothetical protein [Chloroflexus sp.]